MDDTLGFNEQEKKVSDEWLMGDTAESAVSISSRLFQENHDLQVIQKKDIRSDRPLIQASIWEILAYYRGYSSCPSKNQFMSMEEENFKRYLWFYVSNVLCKTLTTTYVYVFFSAYSPDSHFFVSKILPIAHGTTVAFILTAFLELILFTQNTTIYLDYFVKGIFYKSPWNRCSGEYSNENITLKCYEAKEFSHKFVNQTVGFKDYVYVTTDGEYFQMAPMLYYLVSDSRTQLCNNYYCVYFVILWTGAALSYRAFFKRFIWQVLHYSQIALAFILFVTFLHLTAVYFERGFQKYPSYGQKLLSIILDADIDFIAESMTTPPIIHILSSRSPREIKPIQDSAIIVTSNAIFYIFTGFVSSLLKLYCDNIMKAPLQDSEYSSLTVFYMWPIYFSQFYLGDLFGIAFFGLNFVNEYLLTVITFQCLTEAILSEWRCLKAWMVIISLILTGIIAFALTSLELLEYTAFFCKAVVTLMEVVIIFYMYPLGRLVDDITFFSGVRPTMLRVLTFWITPVFYAGKFYVILKALAEVAKIITLPERFPYYRETAYVLGIPMVVGALYAVYKYVFRLKMGFGQLLKPLPNWGPKDFLARRLRKQYDSRVYIGSRAPRELSRYLFEKADLNAYKLDIRYDTISRRSSLRSLRGEVRVEHERL